MTDTRSLTIWDATNITIDGLTKAPGNHWSWDGQILKHGVGIYISVTPEAAQRISTAVATVVPGQYETRSGAQVAQLSEAERAEWHLTEMMPGAGNDPTDDEHIWRYVRPTPPQPGTCSIDRSEVMYFGKTGSVPRG